VTIFDHDARGNTVSQRDMQLHTSMWEYDQSNDNLLWSQDEEGARTTYSYWDWD
jgi:hypothetical protein